MVPGPQPGLEPPPPIPLSLYIHYPWCVRKCPYCDFNSHKSPEQLPEQAYIAALLADLEQHLPEVWGRRLETIFIGGGTPSLLSPDGLDELLAGVRARLPWRANAEVTLEANPGTLDQGRFQAYRQAGVNRLSIGVQSFANAQLEALGRIHDAAQAREAITVAQQAGFDNINLDLMHGLPGQDRALARADLQQALATEVAHISWYQLTIEPNTSYAHQPPILPDEDLLWAIQSEGETLLEQAGYHQYEVSAYARQGRQCRHNLNYWQFGDYLGIGAGAHGKLSDPVRREVRRHWKQRHPERYIQEAGRPGVLAGSQQLASADRLLEFMLNALRLHQGFSPALFEERTFLAFAAAHAGMQEAESLGLIEQQGDTIRPSERGRRHLNRLLQCFMPEDES